MKVIELFNRNLNKSTIELIDSTTFKEQINLLLNSTLVRLSGKEKAIVIGAGKMNDFSLSFFFLFPSFFSSSTSYGVRHCTD